MSDQPAANRLAAPRFQALLAPCVRCGLCLPACPTYHLFGAEMDSPRGRIALMRAASENRITCDRVFRQHIALCLDCRACEPACPSGVQYGALVETTRSALAAQRAPGIIERAARRLALRELLPHAARLRFIARGLRVYQQSGLQSFIRWLNCLPPHWRAMETLLPPLSARDSDYAHPAPALAEPRGTVAFFRGCVQDALLAPVNAATVRVLRRNGYAARVPARQTCCGAAQLHLGEVELARALARQNIDAFARAQVKDGGWVAIVNNAGGCGAALKEYARLLADDPAYAEKAKRFSAQVKDISEFLIEHLNIPPTGAVKTRATMVDSCHLRNAQRIVRPPRDLLQRIPGVELVELAHPERCCGSAGVYNIVQVETANALLDAKLAEIAESGAETIVVANTGCHLQMQAGVRRAGLKARVVHLVELVDESYTSKK